MDKAIEYIWNAISFPETAILSKKIPKKQFLESDNVVANDKKLFRENVKNVYWEYTLKPSTCPILPFKDSEREYLELEAIQIELNIQKGYKRIAEVIHRIIPYPLLLVFYTTSDEFALSIAPKRFSRIEHGALVVEKCFLTNWMNYKTLNECENAFVSSLAWSGVSALHYGDLYNAWVERFIGYECSALSGKFNIDKNDGRSELLTRCREIESKISEMCEQIKKVPFNRQVELNIQIRKKELELKKLIGEL
jgi:hypothetical protein